MKFKLYRTNPKNLNLNKINGPEPFLKPKHNCPFGESRELIEAAKISEASSDKWGAVVRGLTRLVDLQTLVTTSDRSCWHCVVDCQASHDC
ncbi:unnamed protein product [Rhodiola kirilowii]